jgi:hypothetical protein
MGVASHDHCAVLSAEEILVQHPGGKLEAINQLLQTFSDWWEIVSPVTCTACAGFV